MRKYLLSAFLVGVCTVVLSAQNAKTDFTITANKDGSCTVKSYTGKYTEIRIPLKIDGKTVKSLGKDSFRNCGLTFANVPENVTSIGVGAFADNKMTEVSLIRGLEFIGERAFAGNQLKEVAIPRTVIAVSKEAFLNNALKKLVMGEGLVTIGERAFAYNQLTTITIPNTVNTIGANAFAYNQLTSVVIPTRTTTIGANAFAYNQITSITIGSNVKISESDGGESDGRGGSRQTIFEGFVSYYNENGKRSGVYTYGGQDKDGNAKWEHRDK